MGLTIRQAAATCGKSRSTIHRALGNGKLSGQKDNDGTWSIEPSELSRVFPWDVSRDNQRDTADTPETSTGSNEAVLAVKVEMLEAQIERERDTIEDLRRRLDRSEERVTALSPPHTHIKTNGGAQRGLWERVRGLWD